MATEAHNKSLTDLLPDTLIELFEVEVGGTMGIKKFHAGKIIDKDIILGGVTYYCVPIEASGFESKGDGTLPRPKLIVANPDGLITDLIKQEDDMVGNIFTRIRIFLKFIDEVNFPESVNPFGNSDASSRFDDDVYIFNRKISENKYFVEFELVSPLEVENYKLPARIMVANYCPWKYRGIGCRYGSRDDYTGPTTNLYPSVGGGEKMQSVDFFPSREAYQMIMVSNAGHGTEKFKINNPSATYSIGDHTGAPGITVDALPLALKTGNQLVFVNLGVLTLSADAAVSATTVYGNLAITALPDNEVASLSYPEANYSYPNGIAVEPLATAVKFGQKINFGGGVHFTLDRDADINDQEIFGDLVGGSMGGATEGSFNVIDYRVQGVPVADARDKRFDSDFGLTGMRWVYEYNPTVSDIALSATVSSVTISESSNSLEVSVVDIPEDINPKRTMTLFDSGGSEIGTLKSAALALKTVTVELTAEVTDADTVTANGAASNGATSMAVSAISVDIRIGAIITFSGGSTFILTSAASISATTLTGILTGDVATLETGRINKAVLLKPIPVSFKKGEVITFGASQTVKLTQDEGIGTQSLLGTVTTGSTIATGTSGTLRTKIKGALDLTLGTSIAATATIKTGYVKGDVVSISSFNDEPVALFVCVKNHTVFQDPRFKKEYWVEDQCSKTLNACKMRFGDYDHLPFGGFPSIEAYRYTN